MKFSICVIGCGSMSSNGHGPSYQKYASLHSELILAACCDLDEQKAAAYKEKFGFQKYYTDIDQMLDIEKPDAVCLVVPVHLTAPLSIKVLKKGYPLMMEKPPGLNVEETISMIRAADEFNAPTQVAFNRRYMPMIQKLKSILGNGHIPSKIQNIRYDFYRVGRFDEDFAATAIHGIDAAKFLVGSDYSHIHFHYQPLPEFGPNVVNILMDCEFESGTSAQLSFCPAAGAVVERATVNAYNHTFFLNLPIWNAADYPGRLMHYESGKLMLDVSGDEISEGADLFVTNGFYHENVSFLDDIRARRKPAGDLKSALQSVEIADYIRTRKSEYHKQPLL